MKKGLVILAAALMIAALTGCGHVENAKELHDYASKTYGNCKLVDKKSRGKWGHKAYTTITCQDEEYGFTYTVSSVMRANGLDGATFYYSPRLESDFESVYADYMYEANKESIASIENDQNIHYMKYNEWLMEHYGSVNEPTRKVDCFGYIKAYDEASAEQACVAIGNLFARSDTRKYFTTGREEYDIPMVRAVPFEPVNRYDYIGEFRLKDMAWHIIE